MWESGEKHFAPAIVRIERFYVYLVVFRVEAAALYPNPNWICDAAKSDLGS
jgi:hypothetical protein